MNLIQGSFSKITKLSLVLETEVSDAIVQSLAHSVAACYSGYTFIFRIARLTTERFIVV